MRDPTREEIIAQIMKLSRDMKDSWNEIDDIKSDIKNIKADIEDIRDEMDGIKVVKQPRRKSKRSR